MAHRNVSAIAAVCTTRISLDWRDDLDSTVGEAAGAAKRRLATERSNFARPRSHAHVPTVLDSIHSFDLHTRLQTLFLDIERKKVKNL